jgi:putative peptide zinc metalloprotease protein
VWLPENAKVRSAAQGFVRAAKVTAGARVREGQVLFELDDPLLDAQMAVLEARISELEVRKAVEAFQDRVKASIIEQQLDTVRAELERERERAAHLIVRSPADGFLVMSDTGDPVGRFVRKGGEMATVVDHDSLNVRAVVEQSDITLVRERLANIQVRFADRRGETLQARLVREVPAAHYKLPSKVLGSDGGGSIPVEPGDRRGLKVSRKVFQVELALPDTTLATIVGQRVHVRFDHGEEPLALQWGRRLEQIFLRGFGV